MEAQSIANQRVIDGLRVEVPVKRETGGSHRVLEREDWPDFVFSFHDGTEIGPRMLSRIAKHTGRSPSDI